MRLRATINAQYEANGRRGQDLGYRASEFSNGFLVRVRKRPFDLAPLFFGKLFPRRAKQRVDRLDSIPAPSISMFERLFVDCWSTTDFGMDQIRDQDWPLEMIQ
jgi:hypothetical protein